MDDKIEPCKKKKLLCLLTSQSNFVFKKLMAHCHFVTRRHDKHSRTIWFHVYQFICNYKPCHLISTYEKNVFTGYSYYANFLESFRVFFMEITWVLIIRKIYDTFGCDTSNTTPFCSGIGFSPGNLFFYSLFSAFMFYVKKCFLCRYIKRYRRYYHRTVINFFFVTS